MSVMNEQLPLAFPSSSVDSDTAELLALINGDPLHDRDRAAVIGAILSVGRDNGGVVDPNDVRSRLGGSVYPRVVGAVYQSLAKRGVLVGDGWVISKDRRGRNSGKPCRRYRLRASTREVGGDVVAGSRVGDDDGAVAVE
ncbi:hypothetical protein [Haloechinothrix salitolerans]|uniref:Transcriptional regulator PadR-like family protein n=1 Tax=Haloechinothrix salitolerans TaxID=926830 RepID=A0ABW2BYA3_9PSEU